MLNAAIAIESQCHKSEYLSSSCPQLLCAFRRERWGRMDALGLSSCKLFARVMQAGPEVTRGGTDAVGAGNLVYPMGSLGLTFRLLSICTWHPEQAFTHSLPAHTHNLTHRQGRESVACVPQRLCPANTAESLSAVAVATRQQGCSVSSVLRTLLIPKPLPASKTFHLSVFPLYSFGALPEQSQTNLHVLSFKILRKKPTGSNFRTYSLLSHQLELESIHLSVYQFVCLSNNLSSIHLHNCLSMYLSILLSIS